MWRAVAGKMGLVAEYYLWDLNLDSLIFILNRPVSWIRQIGTGRRKTLHLLHLLRLLPMTQELFWLDIKMVSERVFFYRYAQMATFFCLHFQHQRAMIPVIL